MAAFLTRQQIKDKLKVLDRHTSFWFLEHGHNDTFWCLFASEADDITENVGPHERDWAQERIDAILVTHGINPNQDIAPCDG
ncbi:hypothetical protein HDE76_000732 [Rhodanobacter sp. ANJX3]|uniref:hypothetical protein n=1 Tax=Rhodanobacter sp. ANJX3 TaxID=2723083 RepID=UPI00160F8C6D|nr:hypothetical protein [Rhodanobacter sp. ANJX3]MBB5357550.1 hypothetical protein [Rhodanobacter sp. ANJX3]